MKHYLVGIEVNAGGYEKHTVSLIQAPNKYKAGDIALYGEAHDPESLDWDDCGVSDLHGEFRYSINSTQEVPEEEVPILLKYFTPYYMSDADLFVSGNYLVRQ